MNNSWVVPLLPIQDLDWQRLSVLIGKSNAQVSLYNGMLEAIPNPHILLSPMTKKEAVLSSKIEGTQASLTDVLEYEAGQSKESTIGDVSEIMNYRAAMLEAEKMFEIRPFIHLNMIRKLHQILLTGVRGDNKDRGNFRKVANYIAPVGTSIEHATYIPPSPDKIMCLLDNWEKYINSDTQEVMVQLAFMHAQFELIHPFLDGNGRMGRILIPLYLYQKGLLKYPVFYLSEYFEKHRDLYYAKLKGISSNNDWQSWIEFFLNAVATQASENLIKARKIIALYEKSKKDIQSATHSQFCMNLLDSLFSNPITTASMIISNNKQINMKNSTVNNLLMILVENNIIELVRIGKGRQPSIYKFTELLNLID